MTNSNGRGQPTINFAGPDHISGINEAKSDFVHV